MKISVALCTYNGEKYLSQQLDSILNQDQKFDLEIVVCDDGSTDSTLEILNKYDKIFPNHFQIHQNETNLGSTKNFEKAILNCNGDFIFLSDQDDIWHHDKISKIIKKFNSDNMIEGIFTNADLINNNSERFSELKLWDNIFFLEEKLPKPINLIDLILRNGNVATGATLCIKKQVRDIIFPFPNDILHDEWIAKILAINKTLEYINESLISYRIHENQQVGIKSPLKIKKNRHKKNILLGIEKPKNFQDYKILLKKSYLKQKELMKIDGYNLNLIHLKDLVLTSKSDYSLIKKEIKSKYPVRFFIFEFLDKLQGKRKN